MKTLPRTIGVTLFTMAALAALADDRHPLIVVQDLGGIPAQPYYQALNLQARAGRSSPKNVSPNIPFTEASALPVKSVRLSPGTVGARSIHAPGLSPFFVIGDDPLSREWLHRRSSALRRLGAVGFVVNVETLQALTALREQAPGLALSPASGDDLAQRLGLEHYPVLVTATAIEQ